MYPEEDVWDKVYEDMEVGIAPTWEPNYLHLEPQDTTLPGWLRLVQVVEEAAQDGREVFSPRIDLGAELWNQVTRLPPSIGKLKAVKKLDLYRSNLLSIPPEIGEMENLVEFVPYNSYGLHWFPYEITRCTKLRASTVSTRALYGNYKYRQPFPSLDVPIVELTTPRCSVCNQAVSPSDVQQVWISLAVATDVLPLLVNACSSACIGSLPTPAKGYVQFPHRGGPSVQQPLPR